MKNLKIKILSGITVLAVSAVFFLSAASETDPPEFKKYEVVRTVDGETITYDTLVSVESDYSPMEYLTDLGFESDKNISVINFSSDKMNFDHDFETYFNLEDMNLDSMIQIEMVQLEKDLEGMEKEMKIMSEEMGDMKIEKRMIILNCDSTDSFKQIENFHWTGDDADSLMHFEFICDTSNFNFDHQIFMDSFNLDNEMQQIHIEMDNLDMEMHEGMEKMHLEIMTSGDGTGDNTVVIVTEGIVDPDNNRAKTFISPMNQGQLEIFPNPANEEVTIQFTYEGLQETSIIITDAAGNVVNKINLGEFEGTYSSTIDVTEWSKGIYFIQVERASSKLIEKLIIE